jgi:hypothetical protein
MKKAECATKCRRYAGSCLQQSENTAVLTSEHCALALDGERSQTDYVFVIPQGPRQVTDEEVYGTDMRFARKAVCRRLNSVG